MLSINSRIFSWNLCNKTLLSILFSRFSDNIVENDFITGIKRPLQIEAFNISSLLLLPKSENPHIHIRWTTPILLVITGVYMSSEYGLLLRSIHRVRHRMLIKAELILAIIFSEPLWTNRLLTVSLKFYQSRFFTVWSLSNSLILHDGKSNGCENGRLYKIGTLYDRLLSSSKWYLFSRRKTNKARVYLQTLQKLAMFATLWLILSFSVIYFWQLQDHSYIIKSVCNKARIQDSHNIIKY